MAFETEYLDTFTYDVLWERYTGEDAFGNNEYSTPAVTVAGRLDQYSVNMGTIDQQEQLRGETVVTSTFICQVTTPAISPRDRFTLENTKQVYVTSVELVHDEDGPHHLVIQATEGNVS